MKDFFFLRTNGELDLSQQMLHFSILWFHVFFMLSRVDKHLCVLVKFASGIQLNRTLSFHYNIAAQISAGASSVTCHFYIQRAHVVLFIYQIMGQLGKCSRLWISFVFLFFEIYSIVTEKDLQITLDLSSHYFLH